MRWLVTLPEGADLEKVRQELQAAGGFLAEEQVLPVAPASGSGQEVVVFADGPPDFTERLRDAPDVLAVYPDSDQQLY